MITRMFYTNGKHDIVEGEWDKPEITDDEIEVKAVLTGVCRSDVDMFAGQFQLLPRNIQGHEGLGVVSKAGKNIKGVKEGDIVATRGEPAFSDFYNAKDKTFVKVPEINPKYIIEPVACGVNISKSLFIPESGTVLILGTGFLSTVVYRMLRMINPEVSKYVVVGNANKEFWLKEKCVELTDITGLRNRQFKYIVDLSDKPEYLSLNIYAERAIIVLAAEKYPEAKLSFGQFLWKAVNMVFPSPRNASFHDSMKTSVQLISDGYLNVDKLWTKPYDRETEVLTAFRDGLAKPDGYSRGYIEW